jgi:tetratricopeptide (TPR) repeat protein
LPPSCCSRALPGAPPAAAAPRPAATPVSIRHHPYLGGIAAFKKRRFAAARAEFEKAAAADPQSAAAAYYLGYTWYKIGEPSRRMNASKEKAKELFAKAFSLDPAFTPTWGQVRPSRRHDRSLALVQRGARSGASLQQPLHEAHLADVG